MSETYFATESEEFKPITTVTTDIKTATERAMYGNIPKEGERREEVPLFGVLKKIASKTEKKTIHKPLNVRERLNKVTDVDCR